MFRFLPWKRIVRRAARSYGFADPAMWLARIRNFSQPSEVQEPIELLRAGMIFHARGLINTKAIQHNLDWVWPYWVVRQFNPGDIAFLPRAFSFSHINLTHRNWTAIGLPELSLFPIVDPRGLVTPKQDGWSVDHLRASDDRTTWRVNDATDVVTSRPADQLVTSSYDHGDVYYRLTHPGDPLESDATRGGSDEEVRCQAGMATAASIFQCDSSETELVVRVGLRDELATLGNPHTFLPAVTWAEARCQAARLSLPDSRVQLLYDAAVDTLIQLSADEIVPGPYTYRRFWFRDACLMMNPLLAIGLTRRCRRAIEKFPQRQLRDGYFRSQEGEWDSNGQVLWILDRYAQLTREPLPPAILQTLDKAVSWIDEKRLTAEKGLHAGLLPAGFSAEHLGPNDYYYWDDYWAVAGLHAAARIARREGRAELAATAEKTANELRRAIEASIEAIPPQRAQGAIPASPYRRIDAGAVGSLVADYPLQLYPPHHARIDATLEALLANHFYQGGFFQDMIHSGINAYLTLAIAQSLLRKSDARYAQLMDAVGELASPTGQWPEAVHPQTRGGCMGDGQHGWAAGEWVMMVRNAFVREETDRLVVGSGLRSAWFASGEDLFFGPTLTGWGRLSVRVIHPGENPQVSLEAHWHGPAPRVDIEVPGYVRLADVSCDKTHSLRPACDATAAGRVASPKYCER
jgi:hypothetical protein